MPSRRMPPRSTFRRAGSLLGVAALAPALLLQGCAAPPLGPTVQVLPGRGKPFEAFQADDASCRGFASQQTAGQAERANAAGVGSALLGTVLGAGLGAAIGGGRGAAIGAAGGALGGTAIGASGSSTTQLSIQDQYNIAYSQCMYAKGNQIPGYVPAPVVYTPPPPPPPPPVYYQPGYVTQPPAY